MIINKKIKKIILILASVCLIGSSGILIYKTINKNSPEQLTEEVIQLHKKGEFSKAKIAAENLVDKTVKKYGQESLEYAKSLHFLGETYNMLGEYDKAENNFRQSIHIQENKLGKDHIELAVNLSNLAAVYDYKKEYSMALDMYQRALAIQNKHLGENHVNTLMTKNNLATHYLEQNKSEKAYEMLKKVVEISSESYPGQNIHILSRSNLSEVYAQQNKLNEAIAFYPQLLIDRIILSGYNNHEVLKSLNNFATILYKQEKYVDSFFVFGIALNLAKDLPNIDENVKDTFVIFQSKSFENLKYPSPGMDTFSSEIQEDIKNMQEKLNLAFDNCQKNMTEDNLNICLDLSYQAHKLYEDQLGENFMFTVEIQNTIGHLEFIKGDISKSEKNLLEANKKINQIAGNYSSLYGRNNYNLAYLYNSIGDSNNAKKYADNAIENAIINNNKELIGNSLNLLSEIK
ncbi:tetratricopeptide repeat protein [Synechocystis sp. LEGE 06083]|uniref:tetratricopeptide repeat protein n=1 Tax=Synechocystis sp. LEGE 06083 TaxID=915336 RepID=UPI00188034D4|nr:tetratricopeptide repeat protein [Synechocystis sp. LEGE 06083]MBE9195574.1 tetratricopeptide repeat protein [Synechocystis sp. LEGE 06083]